MLAVADSLIPTTSSATIIAIISAAGKFIKAPVRPTRRGIVSDSQRLPRSEDEFRNLLRS
jgi:hypothetical protein